MIYRTKQYFMQGQLEAICAESIDCHDEGYDKASWNMFLENELINIAGSIPLSGFVDAEPSAATQKARMALKYVADFGQKCEVEADDRRLTVIKVIDFRHRQRHGPNHHPLSVSASSLTSVVVRSAIMSTRSHLRFANNQAVACAIFLLA